MSKWYENTWVWLGGAGIVALAFYKKDDISFVVKDTIMKGDRLNNSTLFKGFIVEPPDDLRLEASAILGRDISEDTYALARMIRSEGAKEGELRGHVALNDLQSLGWNSLFYLLTYATDSRKGYYGEQYAPADEVYTTSSVRRYSTSKDPYSGDIELAERILNDRANGIDKAYGAVKFVDKSSLDGVQLGTGSYIALTEKWAKEGLLPFVLPEYGTDIVLFKKG